MIEFPLNSWGRRGSMPDKLLVQPMIIPACREETLDALRNILNQFRRQLRVHRQRKDSLGVLLGDRKIPPLVPQILVSRLQMNRDRIMNACSNASARKMFFQCVAMLGAYDVEMP